MPPVTALRSPPASRITGADSPVTALSFTLATPSTTSPSEGTRSPASTSTRSPMRSSGAGVGLNSARSSGRSSSLALVSDRVRRRLSARARPRPSATASAKVANSTVSQSQAAMARAKPAGPPITRLRSPRTVTVAATISVTKMTGLRISETGLSLTNASRAARPSRSPARRDESSLRVAIVGPQKVLPASMAKCSASGPRARAGRN